MCVCMYLFIDARFFLKKGNAYFYVHINIYTYIYIYMFIYMVMSEYNPIVVGIGFSNVSNVNPGFVNP